MAAARWSEKQGGRLSAQVMFMGSMGDTRNSTAECEMATEVAGTAEARKGAPTRQSLIFFHTSGVLVFKQRTPGFKFVFI